MRKNEPLPYLLRDIEEKLRIKTYCLKQINMMSKEEKVLLDVYRAVYSELGVDIDKLIEDGTTQQEQWFMEYEMPHKRQEDILEEVFTKYKIPKYKRRQLEIAYWLGGSPKDTIIDEI